MLCVKTYIKKCKDDFSSWEEWVKFVNSNFTTDLYGWVGKCRESDLPSTHPYWKVVIIENIQKTKSRHIENYNKCLKDNWLISKYYNLNTRLEDIKERIDICNKQILELKMAL